MMRMIRLSLVYAAFAFSVLSNVSAWAQQQKASAAAPVPAALYTAKEVFISNAGADNGLFYHPFSGERDRAYNEFYDDVKSMGRFDLVTSPEDADLVFELRLTTPYGPPIVGQQKGLDYPLPMFRLVIYDRKSHYVLWTLTESIQWAILQKTHDRNFDTALSMLVQNLKTLTTPVAAGTP